MLLRDNIYEYYVFIVILLNIFTESATVTVANKLNIWIYYGHYPMAYKPAY